MRTFLIITLLLAPLNAEAFNEMYYKGQRDGYNQGIRACHDFDLRRSKLLHEKRELLLQIQKLRKKIKKWNK